jgi:hypothetical protein
MKMKLVVALVGTAALIASVAMTAHAQRLAAPVGRQPEVVSGSDVGFRIDHYNGETPVGELVVKRDGKWVAVQFGASAKPAR